MAFREQRDLQGPDADTGDIRDAAYAGLAESKLIRMLIRNQNRFRRAFDKTRRNLEILQRLRAEAETQKFPNEPKELTLQMIEMLIATPMPHIDDTLPPSHTMRS